MFGHRATLAALFTISSISVAHSAPSGGQLIDIGPHVGTHIPKFAATDASGTARTFQSLSGSKGLVLVFFRSSRWCPFCQRQLIELRDIQAPLSQRGYTLAAISYDKPDQLAAFAQKRDVKYTLLSDANSTMIDAFQLRDPQYTPTSIAYGVPRPAIFVIDRTGIVRAKIAREGYEIRPGNSEILATADSAN